MTAHINDRLRRLLVLASLLSQTTTQTTQGWTTSELVEKLAAHGFEITAKTITRDISVLGDSGIVIKHEKKRYFIETSTLQTIPMVLSQEQLLSLKLLEQQLSGVSSSKYYRNMLREIINFATPKNPLTSLKSEENPQAPSTPLHDENAITQCIARAILDQKCVEILYKNTTDIREQKSATLRTIGPLELQIHDNSMYVQAWDFLRKAWRTFKISRIESALFVNEANLKTQKDYSKEALFRGTVGIWSGSLEKVSIQIHKDSAAFVNEWRLHKDQQLQHLADGSCIITAEVAGLYETLRWVLRWGRAAVVLEPASLRTMVMEHLQEALQAYQNTAS